MMDSTVQKKGSHSDAIAEILLLESDAIKRAAQNLEEQAIDNVLDRLLACAGKVVVIGVGKSGVIAQKIAQTMTSTGTMAIYLHPSDALHGSLGIITKDDVVIALSNSGETDEILAILPAIKQRASGLISIVGNVNSTLARQSDVFLDASVDQEACPLNLAPTTSTTVSLAIGDAISMALMGAKGVTEEDFAANHPAGRLGKRLTLRVGDLMHPSPSVSPTDGWLAVVKAISNNALGAVNVVSEDNQLVGIVTDGDLRRTIERTPAADLAGLTSSDMMTAKPISTTPDTLAFEALGLMENRPSQISVLPVLTENGVCVGLLRLHDIVRTGL